MEYELREKKNSKLLKFFIFSFRWGFSVALCPTLPLPHIEDRLEEPIRHVPKTSGAEISGFHKDFEQWSHPGWLGEKKWDDIYTPQFR